jgi:hypothetical protein
MKTELYTPKPSDPEQGDGFWVNTDSLERIQEKCKRHGKLFALYFILNRVMAEAKCRTFNASIERISKLSGLKPGAIERHLHGLQYVGVIRFAANTDGSFTITILGEVRL